MIVLSQNKADVNIKVHNLMRLQPKFQSKLEARKRRLNLITDIDDIELSEDEELDCESSSDEE